MPKKTAYPKLRSHTRKGKNGAVWTSYYYDRRDEGVPDTPLGNDYQAALIQWKEITEGGPKIAGTLQEAFNAWREEVLPAYKSAETKKGYARSLKIIEPVFGPATWDQVTPKVITGYLKRRTAKTQGNREMALLSVIWAWAIKEELVFRPFPLLGVRGWKNKEQAREFNVTDALFAAVYSVAGQPLKDAMDLATATGLRLTDVRLCTMPSGAEGAGLLNISASKTGKRATFEVTSSTVLSALVTRRKKHKANHLFLLSSDAGRPVSARMLRDWWDDAREKAAILNPDMADELRAMYLRDMRKRASALAGNLDAASELLQHSSRAVTAKHYPTGGRLKPVR